MTARRETPKKRMHLALYADALKQLEFDSLDTVRLQQRVPYEWHSIHDNPDIFSSKRQKVTIRVNDDVIKYFKAMGPGYGEKMNRVLTAYVHGRLAQIVEGPDITDFILRPDKVAREIGQKRPGWGESVFWEDVEDMAFEAE